jgi:hypothetical protein
MKRLSADGGWVAPSFGRRPRGAKKIERNPASSSIPSDWYDEKSWSAAIHERKSSVHNATESFGAMLTTSSSEHMNPAATSSVSAVSPALNHSRVGAYQN